MSQRSRSAVVILASPKTLGHSPKNVVDEVRRLKASLRQDAVAFFHGGLVNCWRF
jgi:hypothetical protein